MGELRAGPGVRGARRRGAPHARARRVGARLGRRGSSASSPTSPSPATSRGSPPTSASGCSCSSSTPPTASSSTRTGSSSTRTPPRCAWWAFPRPPRRSAGPSRRSISPTTSRAVIARLAQLQDPGDVVKGFEASCCAPTAASSPSRWRAPARAGAASPPSRSSCATSRSASWPRKPPRRAPPSSGATPRRWPPSKRASSSSTARARWPPPTTRPPGSSGARLQHRARGRGLHRRAPAPQREDGIAVPRTRPSPWPWPSDEHEATTNVVIGVRDEHGKDQWLSVSSRPLGDAEGADNAAVVCSVSDITERKQLHDRLAWEARNDPLTGLANRSGFLAAVQSAIEHSDAADAGVARHVLLRPRPLQARQRLARPRRGRRGAAGRGRTPARRRCPTSSA